MKFNNAHKRSPTHRRTILFSNLSASNLITYRNPWVVAWWSAALPGFGHLILCKYLVGLILLFWEIYVNIYSNINVAIIYSFIGDFELAKEVLNFKWIPIYIGVYLFGIWDAYRRTVEINQHFMLAKQEPRSISPFHFSALEISYTDKRNPWISVLFSFIVPGLGYLYINQLLSAFSNLTLWMVITYFSNFYQAVYYACIGEFHQATQVLVPQWFLFIPSFLLFSIYDSYAHTVELNRLFEKEQADFLKQNYQKDSLHALAKFFNRIGR